ncbi:MAG: amino acid adenylation domain-containing protein, partial [Arenicellales bacterium]
EHEQQTAMKKWCAQEFQRHFDLTRLPLVRWTLLKFSQNDHFLVHMEHHLVHDGWSFNVFLRELIEIYSALSADLPSPLPELPVQFADFAVWQRRSMQGAVAEPQLTYWQRQLSDMPALLELPADRPRPKSQTFRGKAPRTELPLDLCFSLRQFSRLRSHTLFMTMFTGFVILIHRYTGRTDVPIGTFFANRRWCESEGLIGMVLNNVVIRSSLTSDPTVGELFDQVRDLILEATSNQDVPFDQVVHSVKLHRDQSYNPLFQITFGFHEEPMPEQGPPGIDIEVTPVISNGSAKFDLGVIVVPHSAQRIGLRQGSETDGLTLIWEHSSDLFDEATIERMTAHFTRLLEAMVADPDRPISTLPLLTKEERRQLLVDWNQTDVAYPQQRYVHELFERQVDRAPDAVAVTLDDEQLSYGELNARANQLSHYLRGLGVGPKVLVGLCVERSLEMIVGIMGILKIGGIYVPLDPKYPKNRLAFILEDAQIRTVLTQYSLLNRLPAPDGQIVCLDRDWHTIRAQPFNNATNDLSSKDVAYVIYTSGSTGKPKGVAVPHSAISSHCQIMADHYRLRSSDHMLQFSHFSFDQSLEQILLPLSCGACVVLSSEDVLDPMRLTATLFRHNVTVLNLPPAYWQQWVQALNDQGAQDYPPELRLVIIGGDVIPSDSVCMWNNLGISQSAELLNAYGPTEATITTTTYRVKDDQKLDVVPIGRPLPGRSVYILDRHLQPVPIGIVGELHIGGLALARGYINRPKLTTEKFIPDPFSDNPEARLYKTGDLARYRPDGNIEFLGRLDHQVKIRGFRIELGEIEAALRLHPGVRGAVVNVYEPTRRDKGLAAYVVGDSDLVTAEGELLHFLKQKLPDYMMPIVFVELDALPLTPNGKVDRNALPVPRKVRSENLKNDFVAARTELENKLVDIWTEVLSVERIGINNNFFELGGHSIIAMQIIARIRTALNIELPLITLFELPTIREIAKVIAHSD